MEISGGVAKGGGGGENLISIPKKPDTTHNVPKQLKIKKSGEKPFTSNVVRGALTFSLLHLNSQTEIRVQFDFTFPPRLAIEHTVLNMSNLPAMVHSVRPVICDSVVRDLRRKNNKKTSQQRKQFEVL